MPGTVDCDCSTYLDCSSTVEDYYCGIVATLQAGSADPSNNCSMEHPWLLSALHPTRKDSQREDQRCADGDDLRLDGVMLLVAAYYSTLVAKSTAAGFGARDSERTLAGKVR